MDTKSDGSTIRFKKCETIDTNCSTSQRERMNQHEKGHINGDQITEQQIAKCVIEEAQFELDVPSDVQTSQQHRSKSTRVHRKHETPLFLLLSDQLEFFEGVTTCLYSIQEISSFTKEITSRSFLNEHKHVVIPIRAFLNEAIVVTPLRTPSIH